MPDKSRICPIDYLVIGHVTRDLHNGTFTPGGTASFSSLTAQSLGQKAGVVTSFSPDFFLKGFDRIFIQNVESTRTTTFENIYHSDGRIQVLHERAELLGFGDVPEEWRLAPIVHLGPVAQEVATDLIALFPASFLGITPQGWFRYWNENGLVSLKKNPKIYSSLEHASAVVLSIEDILHDESQIDELVKHSRVLVVTEGAAGARLYWNGDMRYFRPPLEKEVDPTGAGDVFATAFFIRFTSP